MTVTVIAGVSYWPSICKTSQTEEKECCRKKHNYEIKVNNITDAFDDSCLINPFQRYATLTLNLNPYLPLTIISYFSKSTIFSASSQVTVMLAWLTSAKEEEGGELVSQHKMNHYR